MFILTYKFYNYIFTGINGEDSFSSFISASPAQITTNSNPVVEDATKKEEKINNAKSEEESFFNQTIPVEKEKVKLDKVCLVHNIKYLLDDCKMSLCFRTVF